MMNRFTGLAAILIVSAAPACADRALLSGLPQDGARFWRGLPASAGQVLAQGGYEVIRSEAEMSALLDAMADMLEGIDRQDRVVIHLDGQFARSAGQTWYLGDATRPSDLVRAGRAGLSLDVVLEIAARVPGGAFVLLGEDPGGPDHGLGLRKGIAPLDIPQGVTVIRGPSDALARLLAGPLGQPGAVLEEVLAGQSGIMVEGYLPSGHGIVPVVTAAPPMPTLPPVDTRAEERAFWGSVLSENTEAAYRDYLQRYPRGQFRTQAEQALQAILNDPTRLAQDAEAALGLSRAQRRQVQADLTVLGFDTRGVDGIFGAGTRSAILAWQSSRGGRGIAPTGYLDAIQLDRITQQAERARAEQATLGQQDDALWRSFDGGNGTEAELQGYLELYPDGRHAAEARAGLALFRAVRQAPTTIEDQNDWLDALRVESAEGYRRYLRRQPNGYFAVEAGSRLDALEGNTQEDFQAVENALNLNPVTRLLLERRLDALGFAPGFVDGTFTTETRTALRLYQEDRGLTASGFVDEQTVTRMLAELGITFRRN
jgi:peptidoglycan hydrolase-like protein with peptidoglycan-binding domain